jgi:glycolate oxidase iron-sulfur subunit
VAGPYESLTRAALIRLLEATGSSVAIPSGQSCCGTAAAHAGDAEGAERLSAANRQAFAGQATVLSLASGCQQGLAESLAGAAPVEDALAFLEVQSEHLRFRSAGGQRVALHLPCTQRVLKTDSALRHLLARVPDLDLIELPDTGCCGAAGLHMLAEPERAAGLREPLLIALEASGASELLSSNIGCRLHLGNGSKIPVRHPIEFLAEHLA